MSKALKIWQADDIMLLLSKLIKAGKLVYTGTDGKPMLVEIPENYSFYSIDENNFPKLVKINGLIFEQKETKNEVTYTPSITDVDYEEIPRTNSFWVCQSCGYQDKKKPMPKDREKYYQNPKPAICPKCRSEDMCPEGF